jgi:diguanylate cyclase (GGDEF)-like protein
LSNELNRGKGDCPPPVSQVARGGRIDALLKQKKKLERLNTWFEIALNNMVRGLSMFDADQRLIVCNESYREMYALPEELTRPGTPLADILRYHIKKETGRDGEEERTRQDQWLKKHAAKLASGNSFTRTQNLSGGRTFLVTYQPLAGGGWVDVQEDITEKRRAEEKVEWLARHDPLTGIANRFYFRESFEDALKIVDQGPAVVLHWIDLDNFKEVNDTLGHPVGDALLKAVAERLRSSVRKTDFLARLGGDEFAIIQRGAGRREQCVQLAQRVMHALSKPFHILGHSVSLSASIGIVRAPEHGTTADELMKSADIALYDVKSSGRNGFNLFQSGTKQKPDLKHELDRDLRSAIHNGQLKLHYQPIINLKTRHVSSCEALLRWEHPQQGLIMPGNFLPLAEQSGQMLEIGRWVLCEACKDAALWPDDMKVTVNVSSLQFENGDLLSVIDKALEKANIKPSRLELEIAEAALLSDGERIREVLPILRERGIGTSLDDFGRASGSLSYLRNFPFDKIKIDRSYIRDQLNRKDCAAIVNAVTALARALGIGTVAEGVETLGELKCVAIAGCDEVQGYYFSGAVPKGELMAALSECQQKLWAAA